MSSDIQAFRAVLRESRNIIAVAGAGLSAASGIPTFRGPGGFWRTYNAVDLATPEAFEENPSRVWQFYHYRREVVKKAQPNPAHLALGLLSIPKHRQLIAPNTTFTLITQNIDGLSTRALHHIDPTTESKVIEMHGRLMETICTACGERKSNDDSPICPALAGTEDLVANRFEADIPLEELPRYPAPCKGLLRPGVVWFGEEILHTEKIDSIVNAADLILVVGTSSTVYPAAGYAQQVSDNGGKVAIFNVDPPDEEDSEESQDDFYFMGPCEETLPMALFELDLTQKS
ncbi:DHS-like NAD/FAD-binding domain-containing protein [Hygrophoropsis aurantiaca]|uniref:DHS-like NAD/FAD-binding domain-containing protein n=1 Tax=Hygrophoropsis aurantiaca TaxID=72124 RepID=A0ACB8AL76_9AGAM|nr:DHS-like NAD/FAD-binding domain-containing protein [Hygrophoropsis aurantiaca]